MIDGEGARLAGPDAPHAFAYNAWSDALTAVLFLAGRSRLARARRMAGNYRRPGAERVRRARRSLGGYAIVVWAMTQTTIGSVAALRECSAVFASIIGVAFLGEPFRGDSRRGLALDRWRRHRAQARLRSLEYGRDWA